jgi:hypothetical protein
MTCCFFNTGLTFFLILFCLADFKVETLLPSSSLELLSSSTVLISSSVVSKLEAGDSIFLDLFDIINDSIRIIYSLYIRFSGFKAMT